MVSIKISVEKRADGYVAYPLGLNGAVVGEGASYDEALADVRSAIELHIEAFGADALDAESAVLEAFGADALDAESAVLEAFGAETTPAG